VTPPDAPSTRTRIDNYFARLSGAAPATGAPSSGGPTLSAAVAAVEVDGDGGSETDETETDFEDDDVEDGDGDEEAAGDGLDSDDSDYDDMPDLVDNDDFSEDGVGDVGVVLDAAGPVTRSSRSLGDALFAAYTSVPPVARAAATRAGDADSDDESWADALEAVMREGVVADDAGGAAGGAGASAFAPTIEYVTGSASDGSDSDADEEEAAAAKAADDDSDGECAPVAVIE